jgi:RNA polymerase sigma factor (sigma-70 family)
VPIGQHRDVTDADRPTPPGAPDARDIFQDTVLVAWRRLADYDRTRPFGPWLRGIARLVALEHAKRRARAPLASSRIIDAVERDLAALDRFAGDGAEPAMGFRERLDALADCLARLPERSAAVVQAAYRDSRPLAAIARDLEEQEEAVKKRLQRARALLADCLAAKGAFGPEAAT